MIGVLKTDFTVCYSWACLGHDKTMFSLKISDSISTGRDQEEGVGTIASLGDASIRDAGDDEQIIFPS